MHTSVAVQTLTLSEDISTTFTLMEFIFYVVVCIQPPKPFPEVVFIAQALLGGKEYISLRVEDFLVCLCFLVFMS